MKGHRPGSTTQYHSEVKYANLKLKEKLKNDTHGKPTLGGVTSEQLDKSAQKGPSGIEKSQTAHDQQ